MTHLKQDTTPWYKQFWPWFLLGIPLITIFYCAIMIYLAITTENSLVSDNYYKDGLAINQRLSMDQKAKELGLKAELTFSDNGRVALTLTGDLTTPPSYLTLKLLHPTLDGQDVEVKLLPEPGNKYSALLAAPLQGRRYIDISSHDLQWRLKGEGSFPSNVATILNAG